MKSVLLIDDDVHFHRVVAEALRAQQIRVVHAYSLGEANDRIRDTRVDALVVDSTLPDGEGEAWVSALRKRSTLTPVIFVASGDRALETLKRHLELLSPAVVITKPIVATLFAAQVRSLFGSTHKSAQIVRPQWLDELRREYRERLPEIVRALVANVQAAMAAPDRSEALREALISAHSLHGTAGSYGLFRVSETAGGLEQALTTAVEAPSEARSGAWRKVLQWLEETRSAAALEGTPDSVTLSEAAPKAATRVLIVDADATFQQQVATAAKQQLLATIAATSIEEAREIATSSKIDGLLLETHVGLTTTYDLARELRALPEHGALPIAFVSNDASISARVEAVHAGAQLFLRKPLDADSISDALRDLTREIPDVRPRALIVDDDPSFGAAVVELLRLHGIEARSLTDPRAALSAVDYFRPDILLLDIVMPAVGGLDLCRVLRTTPAFQTLPVLLLSSKTDVETRIQAFEAGADDHIGKPLVPKELLARVRGRLERQRLLRERAERDSLTGLLLRGPVVDALRAKVTDAQRRASVMSVALLDLDDFKHVNDTYGHLAGDRVLMVLGRLLSKGFRGNDVRGRWGGEEFLIAFPGEPAEVAEGLLSRVLREFREVPFRGDHGEQFHATFSAGIATYPTAGLTVEALLKAADVQLYRAKRHGKDRVVRESAGG